MPHDSVDSRDECFANAASGVKAGEVFFFEGSHLKEYHGGGVTDCHRGGGAGCGGEFEGAGFYRGCVGEDCVAKFCEGGVLLGGYCDGLDFESLYEGDDAEDFFGFTSVAEGEEEIALAAES